MATGPRSTLAACHLFPFPLVLPRPWFPVLDAAPALAFLFPFASPQLHRTPAPAFSLLLPRVAPHCLTSHAEPQRPARHPVVRAHRGRPSSRPGMARRHLALGSPCCRSALLRAHRRSRAPWPRAAVAVAGSPVPSCARARTAPPLPLRERVPYPRAPSRRCARAPPSRRPARRRPAVSPPGSRSRRRLLTPAARPPCASARVPPRCTCSSSAVPSRRLLRMPLLMVPRRLHCPCCRAPLPSSSSSRVRILDPSLDRCLSRMCRAAPRTLLLATATHHAVATRSASSAPR